MPIGRTIRNLLFVVTIVAALLHEPTLKATMSILVYLHVAMCIVYDAVCPIIFKNLSRVAPWLADVLHDMRALSIAIWDAILSTVALAVQQSAIYFAKCVGFWVRQSPRYLCKINMWVLRVAEWAIHSSLRQQGAATGNEIVMGMMKRAVQRLFQDGSLATGARDLARAKKEVEKFCAVVGG